MANDLVARRFRRYENGLTDRRIWEATWRDIAEFEFPRRLTALGDRQPGDQQNEELLDSTPTFSGTVLASSLQSGLTNPAQKWMGLRTADEGLMEEDEVLLWLEDSTLRQLNAFKLSNMTTELGEAYLDLAFFGTNVIFLGEAPEDTPKLMGNFRGFRFESSPIGTYVIHEDSFGNVNAIDIEHLLTMQAAADRFGVEALSTDSRRDLNENPNKRLKIIHSVFPRAQDQGAKTKLAFASIWYEVKKKNLLSEGGFHEFPFMVPRWSKVSGEVYGRGPGDFSLPDVRTLHKLIELTLKALALAVLPPHKTKLNSVIGAVDFGPGGLTVMRNTEDLEALESRARFDASNIEVNDLRESIRRNFFVDQLLQLLARETPAMTATEVMVKLQLLQQILGPAFSRLNNELLRPLVKRGFAIMDRASAFSQKPEVLQDSNIEVEFEGPLARGQRGQELLAIERTLLTAQNLIGMGFTDVLDNLDPDEVLRLTNEIGGASHSILRTDEERDEVRESRKQQEEEQRRIALLQQGSEIGKNLAPLTREVSQAQEERR